MAASEKTRLALLESEVKAMRQDIDALLRPGPRATAEALYRMREIEREDNIVLRQERREIQAFLEGAVERLEEISALLCTRPKVDPRRQDLDGFAAAILRIKPGDSSAP